MNTTPCMPAAELHKIVQIPVCTLVLEGELQVPAGARGIVIFAHGSGSSRHSPRNQLVARMMREAGVGTLLLDLLTRAEREADTFTQDLSFDVEMLAGRLVAAAHWVSTQPETSGLPLGYFGASSGAGAALVAAARMGGKIAAVVSRGGRPDLAGRALHRVGTPTLFIVGSQDDVVLGLNEQALAEMNCEKELRQVDGATHLFVEPGKLEQVARLSAEWFCRHMRDAAEWGGKAMNGIVFKDRVHAGQMLAGALMKYANDANVIVLGLPRGGVPVAYEVAERLHAPLDVLVVRKVGVRGHEELAMGAIASGDVRVIHYDVMRGMDIPRAVFDAEAAAQVKELHRREMAYRGRTEAPAVGGRIVILVDDGIATGSTIRAAVMALRQQHPRRIVIAVPVAAPETCTELKPLVDDLVVLSRPEDFLGVGQWYEDFSQTQDDEVARLLSSAARFEPAPVPL